MKFRLLAIASLLISGAFLTAQERISVRMAPAPNQTLRLRTTQETNMTMEPDPPGSASPIPAMTVNMTLTLEHTSTVGPTDDKGRYQSRLVVDRATSAMTMNGQPAPNAPAMGGVEGQAVTFFYDEQGKVIDVTLEDGPLPAQAVSALKQLLTSALAAAPPMTLSVGESTTIPTQLSAPLPMGGGDMKVTGDTTYTLTSLTFAGSERIAHLAMKTTSAMNQSTTVGANGPQFAFDMRMSSEGTSDVNIDRGIVLHTEQLVTTDGTMRFAGPNPAMPSMRMHGTTKISGGVY